MSAASSRKYVSSRRASAAPQPKRLNRAVLRSRSLLLQLAVLFVQVHQLLERAADVILEHRQPLDINIVHLRELGDDRVGIRYVLTGGDLSGWDAHLLEMRRELVADRLLFSAARGEIAYLDLVEQTGFQKENPNFLAEWAERLEVDHWLERRLFHGSAPQFRTCCVRTPAQTQATRLRARTANVRQTAEKTANAVASNINTD